MNILRINSVGQLTIAATHERTKVAGTMLIGGSSNGVSFDIATNTGYARKVLICDAAATAVLDLSDGTATGSAVYVPPVAQARKVTATGSATGGGDLFLRVTSALYASLPGGYKQITVKIPTASGPTVWGVLVNAAAAASTDITQYYDVTGATDEIILTHKIDQYGYPNDATFEIQILPGSVPGVTAAASVNVQTGSLATGVLWDEVDGVDAEGLPLPAMVPLSSVQLECLRGVGTIEDGGTNFINQTTGANLLCTKGSGSDGMATDITFTCTTPPYEVIATVVSEIA